ncbi:MAG: hypothetical protein HOC70_17745 [Gammaproteobacteria bacterium]|nr:hypothetical protein [Gammaproteobacteria bacterium]MBT4495090.1 hypothetical protein [Gammaproteobacteria bacterium]MBT7369806.1 hypothetical protein [Gammaproteobacteria bacterium]
MTEVLVDGLCFGEGPRWHDGKLWFSDMHANTVYTVDARGQLEAVVRLENDQPSGLGWLPDGRLLIVSMTEQKLLAFDAGNLSQFADLSQLASFYCNDMVTDARGRSYVGNFGYDLHGGGKIGKAEIILVDTDGSCRIVADDMAFPNGTVITPDGHTLIVGESMGARLTAFDIEHDGSLSNRRIWAEMEGAIPDGICLDEAGGIWLASPISNEALRILEGGQVTDRIKVEHQAYACMLGGPDGKTLHILTSKSSDPEECVQQKSAAIEIIEVEHAGAGLP